MQPQMMEKSFSRMVQRLCKLLDANQVISIRFVLGPQLRGKGGLTRQIRRVKVGELNTAKQ